jgi:hypothetical protein
VNSEVKHTTDSQMHGETAAQDRPHIASLHGHTFLLHP